jgi:hypothetical protein
MFKVQPEEDMLETGVMDFQTEINIDLTHPILSTTTRVKKYELD